MFKCELTGFGDEISPHLDEQLEVMAGEGLKFLELRGVENRGILDFSDEDLSSIKEGLLARGFKISAIGSPIGKIGIRDDFEKHLKDFEKVVKMAHYFNTKYIRVFSYYTPKGEDPAKFRDEVMERMKKKVDIAKKEDVILLNENEVGLFGNIASRCKDILETINSPHLRFTFDPANFVIENEKPYTLCYPLLEKYIEYVHIKDAKFAGEMIITPAGGGDGEVEEVLKALKKRGYEGFLSLEPHLSQAGQFSGFSGPDNFKLAVGALKKILKKMGTVPDS